jgi:hypothetical protein
LLAVSLLLTAAAAPSQTREIDPITLVVGPAFSLPSGPEYVASGDIDKDGLDDAVVTSTSEDFVSILLSAGDGAFRTAITYPVARRLGDATTLDYNSDGNLDIATLYQQGGIAIGGGLGDGRFNPPIFFTGDRLGQGIQAGDLDNQNGPDIATGNGRSKNVSIFINRGGNLGFLQGVEYEVGGDIIDDDIRMADFNSDGWNDLAVINVRNSEADEVSILLNNTRAQFNTVTKFLVNRRAISVTDGDWTDDGIPDLAVLEQSENLVDEPEFTITILVNRTRVENGRVIGTGIFEQLQRVPISCPGSFNSAPIVCTVQDLERGDFNADGLDDLVIVIDTRFEQDPGLAAPGLVQAFIGLGDGNFIFSTRVNVGRWPRSASIGHTDGNLIEDIIVLESPPADIASGQSDDANVRIVRAVVPDPRPDGACREPRQCESGNCVDGICCLDSICAENERCDIPGFEGACHAPADLGDFCSIGAQCQSGFCVDGFCCASPQCSPGLYCNTGICQGPVIDGQCNANEQCDPPFCVDSVCCNIPACPLGQRCDIRGSEGLCSLISPPTPTPTPTFLPTRTASRTAARTIIIGGTRTPTRPPGQCPGDCNDNGSVTVDELARGVGIALDDPDVEMCAAFDTNSDQKVTVEEILQAVNAALAGCD